MNRPLTIGLATLGLPFTGNTLEKRGLGGSETAAISVARSLAKLGHRVMVFCNCEEEGVFDGVSYYGVDKFAAMNRTIAWDVFIASRWPEFLTQPNKAAWRVLWLHDTIQDKGRLCGNLYQTDEIFLLSDFHIDNYTVGTNEKDEKENKIAEFRQFMWKTSNGIDLDLIEKHRQEKVPLRFFYSSRPERGLHWLLRDIWPKVLEKYPQATLHYCNYSLGGMQVPEHVTQINAMCKELTQRFGDSVVNVGHLTKDRLYEEMSKAQALLYPTDFPEISCITAMEAAACKTPIITTDDFALRETVGNSVNGFLIRGKPGTEEYTAKFVRRLDFLLSNPDIAKSMQDDGPQWIMQRGYTWDAVAENWTAHFREKLAHRVATKPTEIVSELLRSGNVMTAVDSAKSVPGHGLLARAEEELAEVTRQDPIDPENITRMIQDALPRFKRAAELVARSLERTPNYIIDFASGVEGFGLVAAKMFPEAQVVMFDADEEIVSLHARSIEQMGLGDRVQVHVATSIPGDYHKKADVVFVGGYLESLLRPWEEFEWLSRIPQNDGVLVVTSKTGATSATLEDGAPRLWSLTQEDYSEMVGTEVAARLAFVEEDISDGGDIQGSWVCVFGVENGGFKAQPLNTVRRVEITRPYQSLAVCMIVRDGEDYLAKCLKHVEPIADKIVVAFDTRTSDHTRQLFEWHVPQEKLEIREVEFDHFAQMRNASIEGVTEDWIFWLDTDEIVTDPAKLRRYLHTTMLEGFGIKQCHLMLDVHGTFDMPIRVLRNREHYRFVGCIHEHCEDTSKGGYDNPIRPTMLIPDVNLAHYGYLHERQRRDKCSNRNMALLQRDHDVYPGRQLTWVLIQRDHINVAKWSKEREKQQRILPGSPAHKHLEAAIRLYLTHLADPSHVYNKLAFPMYQEALAMLSENKLCYADRPCPPFSIALGLSASMGKQANKGVEADDRWFLDRHECRAFFGTQVGQMLVRLGAQGMDDYKQQTKEFKPIEAAYPPEAAKLLEMGTNAIHTKTGRLR